VLPRAAYPAPTREAVPCLGELGVARARSAPVGRQRRADGGAGGVGAGDDRVLLESGEHGAPAVARQALDRALQGLGPPMVRELPRASHDGLRIRLRRGTLAQASRRLVPLSRA